ncbi:hypothetical protein EYF80_020230 [Liparis tanakae]|uniref:Uncharacterized protein n=1 Tax=Liparis tanakae TaxID=230148 RepID=A0A4Z2HW94_9TELE|nr:hypothetical protein EYF80_020230 [Liparis tanakae]
MSLKPAWFSALTLKKYSAFSLRPDTVKWMDLVTPHLTHFSWPISRASTKYPVILLPPSCSGLAQTKDTLSLVTSVPGYCSRDLGHVFDLYMGRRSRGIQDSDMQCQAGGSSYAGQSDGKRDCMTSYVNQDNLPRRQRSLGHLDLICGGRETYSKLIHSQHTEIVSASLLQVRNKRAIWRTRSIQNFDINWDHLDSSYIDKFEVIVATIHSDAILDGRPSPYSFSARTLKKKIPPSGKGSTFHDILLQVVMGE